MIILQKLKPNQYEILKGYFVQDEFTRASAVVNLNRDGEVFVDDAENPNIIFVNTTNFSFISGNLELFKKSGGLKSFFNDIFDKDASKAKKVMKIISPNEEWIEAIMDFIKEKSPYRVTYHSYSCEKPVYDWKSRIDDNFKIVQIDSLRIKNSSGEFAEEAVKLLDRVYWHSMEQFIENSGGACLLNGDKIISYSFIFYNREDDSYELSIATDKNYRMRGFGAITTSACIDIVLSRAKKARWLCKEQNEGSVKTALKSGFNLAKSHDVVFVELKH